MSQQSTKRELAEFPADMIDDLLQQIGPPSITGVCPTGNVWNDWSRLLSQPALIGFSMLRSPEHITQASKETYLAIEKSSLQYTEGCYAISQHVTALIHQSVTIHMSITKKILEIKTPNDWLTLQFPWTGDSLNTSVNQITQLIKLSSKVIAETCEPLTQHFSKMSGFT